MNKPFSICVFCGSRDGDDPSYAKLANELGKALAKSKIRLIYGGGNIGLMGQTARACADNGGEVLGIIPEFLQSREIAFEGGELRIVQTLHERKAMMAEECNGFIVLPGGLGTLEEVIEVLSWINLDELSQPVVMLDNNGFWDLFYDLIAHTIAKGFTEGKVLDSAKRASSAPEAIALVTSFASQ